MSNEFKEASKIVLDALFGLIVLIMFAWMVFFKQEITNHDILIVAVLIYLKLASFSK